MMRKFLSPLAAVAALALSLSPAAYAESGWGQLNMTQGVTAMSRQIYGLHMLMFWLCVGIAAVVFGVMAYSIFAFRKSRGAVADTTLVHSTTVEIIWTIVPIAILVATAVPAATTLIKTEDLRNSQLTIKVTGFQWGWNYEYLNNGVSYFFAPGSRKRRGPSARFRHRCAHRAALPAERGQPAGRAGRHQGARAGHGERCDSFLVGAGIRRQEGHDPGPSRRT